VTQLRIVQREFNDGMPLPSIEPIRFAPEMPKKATANLPFRANAFGDIESHVTELHETRRRLGPDAEIVITPRLAAAIAVRKSTGGADE
jgi:hypothetical protein